MRAIRRGRATARTARLGGAPGGGFLPTKWVAAGYCRGGGGCDNGLIDSVNSIDPSRRVKVRYLYWCGKAAEEDGLTSIWGRFVFGKTRRFCFGWFGG
jgi:hypothetical protein